MSTGTTTLITATAATKRSVQTDQDAPGSRESGAFSLGVRADRSCIFGELVGNRAPAVLEAHLLVASAVGVVLVHGNGLVGGLAAPRVGERNEGGEGEGFATF